MPLKNAKLPATLKDAFDYSREIIEANNPQTYAKTDGSILVFYQHPQIYDPSNLAPRLYFGDYSGANI